MTTIQILLIDDKTTIKPPLEHSLTSIESASFHVDFLLARDSERYLRASRKMYDVILLGEKLSESMIVKLARLLRKKGSAAHIILLTRNTDEEISPRLRRAGIDDLLNVAEINTPIFGWTFLSTLSYADSRKGAEGFLALQKRLHTIHDSMKHVSNGMRAPIRLLRALLSKMKGQELTDRARKTVLSMDKAVGGIDRGLEEMLELRERLERETKLFNKILTERTQ
jgi:CheY-like chemotaxis protein